MNKPRSFVAMAQVHTDVSVTTQQWVNALPNAINLCRAAATASLSAAFVNGNKLLELQGLGKHGIELSVLITDDAEMTKLNHKYRGKVGPTNVLSFCALDEVDTIHGEFGPVPLGDVAVAFETAASEATSAEKSLGHHLTHLIVHGVLHLLGYDHRTDIEAQSMEQLEVEILGRLDVPDPYGATF